MKENINDTQEVIVSPEVKLVFDIEKSCEKIDQEILDLKVLIEKQEPNDSRSSQNKWQSVEYINDIRDRLSKIKLARMSAIRRPGNTN